MPRHNPSLVGAKLSHQSARTPKQIRNLLSRRASSKRFPATITASSSQAFTCAKTDTIEPARIGRAGARATRARAAEALGKRGRNASGSGSASSKSGSSRTARHIPINCFLENAAPDEDGSDGHHPQHGHDDADRARGAKARRRKQQHCNRAADGTT